MDESTLGNDNSDSKEETCLSSFIQQIQESFVPEISSGFDKPISDSDFAAYIACCDEKLQTISEFVEYDIWSVNSSLRNKYKKRYLSSVFILSAQHSFPNKWTTENSTKLSVNILSESLKLFNYLTIEEALRSDNCALFKFTLNKMRPWLLKESWKNYPAIPQCYSWMLCKVKSPHLSDLLDIVLPTALILTDDFVKEYRLIGLKCLEHIINNVTKTELSWFGHNEVILKALEPLFYEKDAEIIAALTQTFVALLNKEHLVKSQQGEFFLMNEFHGLIEKFIHNMMFEQNLNLRSAYIEALPKIIEARGLGIMIHSSSLIELFTEYVLEPTSSLEALYALEVYIDLCWLRMSTHCNTILLLISKCALALQPRGCPPPCAQHIKMIFQKLKKLCPEKVNAFMNNLNGEVSLREIQEILN